MQAGARIPRFGSGPSLWRPLAAPQLPLARAFAAHRLCSPSGWCNGRSWRSESIPGRLTRVHAFAKRSLPHSPGDADELAPGCTQTLIGGNSSLRSTHGMGCGVYPGTTAAPQSPVLASRGADAQTGSNADHVLGLALQLLWSRGCVGEVSNPTRTYDGGA